MSLSTLLRIASTGIAACMAGPCFHHIIDAPQLSARVADLGAPFDLYPAFWALMVSITETVGTLLVVFGYGTKAARFGALLLLPKMTVACYGHAFVDGFDAKFGESYKNAMTPSGLSYNWAVGAGWECGIFGAGFFAIAYALLAVLPTESASAEKPRAKAS